MNSGKTHDSNNTAFALMKSITGFTEQELESLVKIILIYGTSGVDTHVTDPVFAEKILSFNQKYEAMFPSEKYFIEKVGLRPMWLVP
ncbi:hypothetical protein OESDEN_20760 [Oesophagostomum dentatum]|uniref:Uncharacterized protein n=1 Tax=Oesophagostomum dentatum TaxID=61180 RepID=A0A0B1S2L1_OESDE|nr:hypothetical protein OESDEN_20760 [Oesophagostomum dentatum]